MFQRAALPRPTALVAAAVVTFSASLAVAASSVEREPRWGIPHIYADTDLELGYEAGRQVAIDRLVQLILFVRAGRGTLAQAFGLLDPGFIDDDIDARRTAYTSPASTTAPGGNAPPARNARFAAFHAA